MWQAVIPTVPAPLLMPKAASGRDGWTDALSLLVCCIQSSAVAPPSAVDEKFSLRGLASTLKPATRDQHTLGLGMDLTTLGLNLSQAE